MKTPKNEKWDVDNGTGVMWVFSEASKSLCGSMKSKLGMCFENHLVYLNNHEFWWCTQEKELKKIGIFLINRFKDKKFSDQYARTYKAFYDKSVKELNNLEDYDSSKISNNELFKKLVKANNTYLKNLDWGFVMEPFDSVMGEIIETRLKKQKYKSAEIMNLLTISDISFLNKESQDIIAIAKQKKEKQEELLKKHAYDYRWIQSAHMGKTDIPFSYFENNLKEIKRKNLKKELEKLKGFKRESEENKNKILSKKPIDNETRQLLNISSVIAPFHNIRKELFLRSIYATGKIREEIGKRHGYAPEEISIFQLEEILKLKKGTKLSKKYSKQKETALYINKPKKTWKCYYGNKARKIFEKELLTATKDENEIRGTTASSGKAEGIVKVIQGTKDMDKMEKGNIIIASMTRPEMVPALKKAAAIVTNEGGVTCHAAIISRELNIPCIIGTKTATQMLQDGDLIKVDADNGVVKILKKATVRCWAGKAS